MRPVQVPQPPVCGPMFWSTARLHLVTVRPQFRVYEMMLFMSSFCWLAIHVPPECSVSKALVDGYWLCTVDCIDTSPPYPCQAMPPKRASLRSVASAIGTEPRSL